MSDEVSKFCDGVQGKLETLDGRIDSLKLNIGTTWHSLQDKIKEVRHSGEATKQTVAEAPFNLEQWDKEKKGRSERQDRSMGQEPRDSEACRAGPKGGGLCRGCRSPFFREGIEMKRFLAFVLIAALGVFTIGCESDKGTTKNKTEIKTTQTKDGKTTGETISTETKTKTTPPAAGGMTTEKTTEKTTETTK